MNTNIKINEEHIQKYPKIHEHIKTCMEIFRNTWTFMEMIKHTLFFFQIHGNESQIYQHVACTNILNKSRKYIKKHERVWKHIGFTK